MKNITGIGKIILAVTLILSLTSCTSGVSTLKTAAEPTKESLDIFMEAVVLVNSIKYNDARKLLEDKYYIIKDNDMALNTYGFMEFHIFNNYEKAEELYKRAIKLNSENPSHYSGLASIYEAKGKYKKAIGYHEIAIKSTASYEDIPFNPKLATFYKDIGKCYLKLNNREKAVEALKKACIKNPYSIEANALLHKLYVEDGEYEKAYEVWKKDNLMDDSGDHVYKGLLKWDKDYKDAVENKDAMTHLKWGNLYETLILYDEAAVEYKKALAQDQTNDNIKNKIYEIECYLSFRDELQVLLDDYYRQRCINGSKEEITFHKRIKPVYEKIAHLFPQAGSSTGIASIWIGKLNDEIEKKFSIRIENIKANGSMLGLHFGRIIDASAIHSALWGEEIDLKVVTLKNMTSNGLDNWRYIGGGVGGWSLSRTEVVRVIQDNGYENGIRLASIYNEDAREDFIKEFLGDYIREEKEEERQPLELFFSPEILMHFITKQTTTEVKEARAQGIPEKELQAYLFNKMEKDFSIKTCIFVHESQHSIDSAIGFNFKWMGENEYRPKLSELAYGSMAFMSLSQFYNPSIGVKDNNTHTLANTQVIKDIVQYIYDNNDKFPQIDVKKNILAQLTKLSDDELKGIAIEVFQKSYPNEKYQ